MILMKKEQINRSDFELWKSFKEGNDEALKTIYYNHFKHLYNYGRKFSSDKELVENCVQDLYIDLIKKRENLGDTNNISLYLLKAIKRKIIRRLQQEKKTLNLDFTFAEWPSTYESITSNTNAAYREKLFGVINQLSHQQREIIYLKYFNSLNNKEIAEILDLNYQTVRNVLVTALKKLRKSMKMLNFFFIMLFDKSSPITTKQEHK
ncbi:sigma-70 family RNA polymerase sigma factor [Tamlana sp. 2201CG12-4]|uniref:RNA polymerase sigma factor n=1 Tax=Tamlana sp. 2201CG12-4 TaxID=3112582 RepID=UPI002DB864C4|nr:sigma-70 family RNA polymerase sigma factor [Tamlana sp. 2201CG12-4]MEC3908495.1 sigma-70 family RNA polymerase sigma factor [Tamlana sp. 2201CG12-4]